MISSIYFLHLSIKCLSKTPKNYNQARPTFLFLASNSNFLPYLLLAWLFKNLSLFQLCDVFWKRETGSFFFLELAGVLSLKVYAAFIDFVFFWVFEVVVIVVMLEVLLIMGSPLTGSIFGFNASSSTSYSC